MRDLLPVPAEVSILGAYYPPSLVAAILGAMAMALTTWLVNRRRLFRYVYFPNLITLAMFAIYTVLISTFVFPA